MIITIIIKGIIINKDHCHIHFWYTGFSKGGKCRAYFVSHIIIIIIEILIIIIIIIIIIKAITIIIIKLIIIVIIKIIIKSD